jgi:hypothetical protein
MPDFHRRDAESAKENQKLRVLCDSAVKKHFGGVSMSEPTLIQVQRAILRRLRQTTAHHTQLTTAADAQWQSQTNMRTLAKSVVQ